MAETLKVTPEPRMLIDGQLVEATAGRTFDNVNPATEEVLGQVADASTDGHAPCHRRGTPDVRRDGLVDEPGLPRSTASSSSRRRWRRSRRSSGSS